MALQAYSLARDGSTALSPHFCVREFRCKDGSDPVFIDTALAELLERIREHFGKPVTITSAYRTPAHNAKAGGAKFSQHLYGRAADIRVQDVSVEDVAAYAESLMPDRGGVGRYPVPKVSYNDNDTRNPPPFHLYTYSNKSPPYYWILWKPTFYNDNHPYHHTSRSPVPSKDFRP